MNYTPEQTQEIVRIYLENPTRKTVDQLAESLERSPKSIIGKLSREGVYRREEYLTKTGDKPVTKLELVSEIEDLLEVRLSGLEKTPKPVLKTLTEKLQRVLNES